MEKKRLKLPLGIDNAQRQITDVKFVKELGQQPIYQTPE